MNRTSLILCIHNHQPVGNLPGVFEHAYKHAYEPFLSAMEEFPEVKFVVHNSGPLLEWYEQNAPDYIERLRALVARGQVEVLTGAFYEPILASIPERDAIGQIGMLTEYVETNFGARPRGMWLAERVWEPHLARTVARAGVEYVPLDDYEFSLSGIPEEELTGYFITEDQGIPLRVFPICRRLRYAIPFQEPTATLDLLRSLAERGPAQCTVFGDDGEKFGLWPGTYAHVHENGWLRRFLTALRDNADWVSTVTFSEIVDASPAKGRVYLPASSYPEMMEWALPTKARSKYEGMIKELRESGRFEEWGPFLSGGIWRGFIAKYEESNLMVRKMMRVSDKIARARATIERLRELDVLGDATREAGTGREPAVDPVAADAAETELWRGQCNCAYWHGVFGGLYLPHLRSAIYEHLIKSENLVDAARGSHWSFIDVADHDLDGRDEVLLETHWANVYVSPGRGGTIFELDLRDAAWNVLGTMTRYVEAYHRHPVAGSPEAPSGGVASIHDSMAPREEGLERLTVADSLPRRGALDRFLPAGAKRVALERAEVTDVSDFAQGVFEFAPSREEGGIGVCMHRSGHVGGVPTSLEKKICIEADDSMGIEYVVSADAPLPGLFSSEWNLAFLTGAKEYVYFERDGSERAAGAARQSLENVSELRATDLIRGARLFLRFEPACTVWTYPLETASQSEGGLERVFQGSTLVAVWDLARGRERESRFTMTLRAGRPEE